MTRRQTILTGILLIVLSFQALVLVVLAFFPYLPDPGFSNLNFDTYFLLAPLSTIFLLELLYSWLAQALAREAIRYSSTARSAARFFSEPFQKILSSVRTVSLSDSAETFKILSRPRLLLIISLAQLRRIVKEVQRDNVEAIPTATNVPATMRPYESSGCLRIAKDTL